jgi:hypothetical protein
VLVPLVVTTQQAAASAATTAVVREVAISMPPHRQSRATVNMAAEATAVYLLPLAVATEAANLGSATLVEERVA